MEIGDSRQDQDNYFERSRFSHFNEYGVYRCLYYRNLLLEEYIYSIGTYIICVFTINTFKGGSISTYIDIRSSHACMFMLTH